MTDFDTILRDWKDTMMTDIKRQVDDLYPDLGNWREMPPSRLPITEMTDCELLDEFCFFAVEHKEARGRNSAFNDNHLVSLFAELKRRQLFPE